MNKKRLLVVSADAMICEDLELLKELPNFRKYLSGGCEVTEGMRSVYPSVTYPAHVSMITGCYPGTHGLTSNFRFSVNQKDQNWLWYGGYQVEDLFAAAKQAGYTTAAISWPATAGNQNVDWLMAEYWMPKPGDTLRSSFADAGSSEEMLEIIEANKAYLPNGWEKGGKTAFMQWPVIDDFNIHVACDVLRKKKPEVCFVHTGTFDTYRHRYGVSTSWTREAVFRLDGYLGALMEACRAGGFLEQVNLVLVSDHGQRNISRILNLNVLFADQGWLQPGEKGEISDWQAISFSNAMSALVYLRHPEDEEIRKKVYSCLCHWQEEGIYGIGAVFTVEEAWKQYHLKGSFSFVIESDGYTSFGDRAVRPLVQNFDDSDYRHGRATHGGLPEYGPQPVFVAKGPDFQNCCQLKRRDLVDEAPTYARLLGITLKDAEGKEMEEFLR